jgi:hypothetical protein
MEVQIERGGGEVAVETEVFTLLFWLVRKCNFTLYIVNYRGRIVSVADYRQL